MSEEIPFTETFAETFAEGGWAMYPLTFLACLLPVLGFAFLAVSLFSKRNLALPLGIGLLVASVLPPAIAVAAVAMGRSKIDEVLPLVQQHERDTVRLGSEGELMVLSQTGYGAALCPGFLGFVLLGLGLGRLPRFGAKPPA